MRSICVAVLGVAVTVCLATEPAFAKNSASIVGPLGLNTIPSARMDPVGTIRTGVSYDGFYTNGTMGVQIAPPLYLGLRQSVETHDDTHLHPGMDIKLRLFNEKYFRPEISIGIQSAFGHKRMAAEYLALSKRYHDFDFTLGMGWGRLGTRGGFFNPLLIHSFSGNHRSLDGENPTTPADWFTGDAALFGGVQYDVPFIEGLSLKADWSSDSWKAERAAYDDFSAPAPWSVGISYRPFDWIDAGVALRGTDTVMAQFNLSPNLQNWGGRDTDFSSTISLMPRTDGASAEEGRLLDVDKADRLGISRILIDDLRASAALDLDPYRTPATQIGEAARQLSNMAGEKPEQIALSLSHYGLKGPILTLNRRDLEQAELHHQGSAEEIWRNTYLSSLLPDGIRRAHAKFKEYFAFKADWVTDLSLSEDDAGVLYRSALVPSLTHRIGRRFLESTSVRINLSHNLDHLAEYRGVSLFPVRADEDAFTQNRIVLERQFMTGFVTLGDDLHLAIGTGYLEEMYAGLTGEILYRPFAKPWAIGLELSEAFKRDPSTPWAIGLNGDHILSGHLDGYYEIPNSGATFRASVGRYLAGDVGGTLSLSNEFDNGVRLEGLVTATNESDPDIYGGKTNFFTGISLSLPLGSLPFVPDGSRAVFNTRPIGRDTGQRLDSPFPLYEATEPLSYRGITRHWSDLTRAGVQTP